MSKTSRRIRPAPCVVNIRITYARREKDPMRDGQERMRYQLRDEDGNLIGDFHTPVSSRLAEALEKEIQKRK
jgi:hypothetical protein